MTDIAKLKGAIRFLAQWSKSGDVQRWFRPGEVDAHCINGIWQRSGMDTLRLLTSLIDGRRTLKERQIVIRAIRAVRKLDAMGLAA